MLRWSGYRSVDEEERNRHTNSHTQLPADNFLRRRLWNKLIDRLSFVPHLGSPSYLVTVLFRSHSFYLIGSHFVTFFLKKRFDSSIWFNSFKLKFDSFENVNKSRGVRNNEAAREKKRKMKRPGAIFPPVPDERSRAPSLAARPSKSLSSLFFFFFKLKINNFKIYLHLSQAVRIFPENSFGMKWGNFDASPTGGTWWYASPPGGTCVGHIAKTRFGWLSTQVPLVGLGGP